MKELDNKALQEYLKNAIDLETDVETQKQIIAYNDEIASQNEPVYQEYSLPKMPQPPEHSHGMLIIGLAVTIGLFLLMFSSFSNKGYDPSEDWGLYLGFGILILVVSGWMPIVGFIQLLGEKSINDNYQKNVEHYTKKVKEIQQLNKKKKEEYTLLHTNWLTGTSEMKKSLEKPYQESQALLEKLYASDVIFPKYRNLPALTSISEYLITGRCDSLTGPHGAYNLYEEELRQDTIIAQLNVVIRNLEQIKQNQYLLYEQVSQINRVAQGVYSELRQIKNYSASIAASSALTAYYAGRNERHNRISMYCDLLD